MITDLVQIRRLGEKKRDENLQFRRYLKSHDWVERQFRHAAEEVQDAIDCRQCPPCLTNFSISSFLAARERLEILIVEDHELIVGQDAVRGITGACPRQTGRRPESGAGGPRYLRGPARLYKNLGRRRVTARSNRISPRLSARIKPERLMAPAAVKLACTRIWLLPGSRATRFDPSSLPSALISTVPCHGFRRGHVQVDGKLLAGECQGRKTHGFQAQIRAGRGPPGEKCRWGSRGAGPARRHA